MRLKKIIALCLTLILTVGLLTGCGTTVVVLQEQPAQQPAQPQQPAVEETPVRTDGDAVPVKLGLSFLTSTTSSAAASADCGVSPISPTNWLTLRPRASCITASLPCGLTR